MSDELFYCFHCQRTVAGWHNDCPFCGQEMSDPGSPTIISFPASDTDPDSEKPRAEGCCPNCGHPQRFRCEYCPFCNGQLFDGPPACGLDPPPGLVERISQIRNSNTSTDRKNHLLTALAYCYADHLLTALPDDAPRKPAGRLPGPGCVKLLVVQERTRGQSLRFPPGEYYFGRGDECHIRPNSGMVSRQHCLLRVTTDGVFLRDLGSRNGTLVNGTLLDGECELHPGDQLQIGPLIFGLEIDTAR
jgi:hypothetical protein